MPEVRDGSLPSTMHPVLILGGLAAGYLVVKKLTAPAVAKAETLPAALFTPKDFNLSKALQFPLDAAGKTVTVRPGTSLQFSKTVGGLSWADPGVVSSNDKVLAPSVPTTITGFVAVGEGAAEVKGYYFNEAGEISVLKANVIVSRTA